MGVDNTDFDRLLAGTVPSDDAELGQVSAFLGEMRAANPPVPVAALEDHHLAVIAREVRTLGAARTQKRRDAYSRKRLRRTLAAFAAGLLTVLTAGAGVASALGHNPLEFVPGLGARPSAAPNASALTHAPSDVPGGGQQSSQDARPTSADPSVPPTTTGRPTDGPSASKTPGVKRHPRPSASPTHGTSGNCGNGKGAGNASCTAGNSGKDQPGSSATAAAKGKADPATTVKPTPTSTRTNGRTASNDEAGAAANS